MKKIVAVIIFMISALSAFAQGNLFAKYSDTKGVDAVYISKSMLQMMPTVKVQGMNVANVVNKLNSIQILTTIDKNQVKAIKKDIGVMVKEDSYEILMLIKDDFDSTAIYSKKEKNKTSKELMIVNSDVVELSVIWLLGDFSVEDIQSITKTKKK